MNNVFPAELSAAFGSLRHIKYRGGKYNEWSAECPVCGSAGHSGNDEPDRFRMFPTSSDGNARGWCRQCGHFQWANSNKETEFNPVRIKEEQEIRRKLQEEESIRKRKQIEEFKRAAIWEFYHDQMKEEQRTLWRKAGIPDNFQNYWRLGYTDHYSGDVHGAALTIPYFAFDLDPVSLQFRLLNPPTPNDKYKFLYGMNHKLWLAEPEREMHGTCLLTEGMKKGAVTFIKVIAEANNSNLMVVSLPSAAPPLDLLEQLSQFDEVIVALDPDTHKEKRTKDGRILEPQVRRIIKNIKGPIVRLATLPVKADDFFVEYGGTADHFMSYVHQARQVKPKPAYMR